MTATAAVSINQAMRRSIKLISLILLSTLLLTSLFSCNSNKDDKRGNNIGDRCIATDLELVSGRAKVNIDDYLGKTVVLNFWGTWCPPCRGELPHFDEVAEECADSVTVITVHTNYDIEYAPTYIYEYYVDSKILFAKDTANDGYYTAINPGENSYPITVILNKDGIIVNRLIGAITKEKLVSEIEKAK